MTSADRLAISRFDAAPCARSASLNCAAILVTGFSAFIALCITTEYSHHRSTFSCFSVMVTRFCPRNETVPPVIDAGGLNNAAIANNMVDLPQPDSPTTPTNSPLPTVRSTLSTAQTDPRDVLYSTRRPDTSRIGALDTRPPDRPQRRVADLVECIVEKCE